MDEQALEAVEIELALLLRRMVMITCRKKFSEFERSAYLLIHLMLSGGPTGVKAIADKLQLDISTVSRQAAALEQKGYIYRIADPLDGRAYSFRVTELGMKEFDKYKQERMNNIGKLLEDWSDEERKRFGELLKKFNGSLARISE